jgi:chemotaxis protein CheX
METTYDSHIEQIVQSVFSTMIGVELAREENPVPQTHHCLIATIQITGAWVGSVVLGMSAEVARATAAAMLQMSPEDVTDDDDRDVAGELVNMIGGNLKCVLPSPSSLSLPTVAVGQDVGMHIFHAELIDEVQLRCESGLVHVGLHVRSE